LEAIVQEMGTVKWYNTTKRFGFIVLDNGGKEVFVHASVLSRAGLISLSEGQRVFVSVVEGQRGPQASSLQIAA
jgi:CspA family cold shock protein